MRHRRDHRKLSRTSAHRKALLRNLVTALFLHERITTTIAKAKEARRVAERLITYAKRNNLHSRRLVAAVVMDRAVVTKIFEEIAPLYTAREGGYTRVLRTSRRLGDAGEIGILELVKTREQKDAERKRKAEAEEATKPKKKGFFGRKKAAAEGAEGAAVEAKAEKAGKPAVRKKAEKPAAEKSAEKSAEKTPEKKAARKDRKPRAKDEPGGGRRGPGATLPGISPRKSRGSQRGQ
jgi:large subunit ribosomal protein L17